MYFNISMDWDVYVVLYLNANKRTCGQILYNPRNFRGESEKLFLRENMEV